MNALLDQLAESEEAREMLIDFAGDGRISATLLTKSLHAKAPFSPSQVKRLCDLLGSSNPKLRFSALNVLDTAYLTHDEIKPLARERTTDSEQEIRDAAWRILD